MNQRLKNFLRYAFFFLALLTFSSGQLLAADNVWERMLKKWQITPTSEQAYCYMGEDEDISGVNSDIKIRLASVSKIYTTLLAVQKLGPHYQFEGQIYIDGGKVHITGGSDPYVDGLKLQFIVSELNRLGIYDIDQLSFSKSFFIYETKKANSQTKWHLQKMLNTKNWGNTWRRNYQRALNAFSGPDRLARWEKNVRLTVRSILYSETVPFELSPSTQMYTLKSPPLYIYLKEMNVVSDNFIADTIFDFVGGQEAMTEMLLQTLAIDSDVALLSTGSGLDSRDDGARFDNYSTCAATLNVLASLHDEVQKHQLELQDVMAVPGSDGGTFRNRFIGKKISDTMVAKTGTLHHTSTLAGALNTNSGLEYFGIFNQTRRVSASRALQNAMVNSIFDILGGMNQFEYTSHKFYSVWDNMEEEDVSVAISVD